MLLDIAVALAEIDIASHVPVPEVIGS
jgi:hypothetical protein